MWGYGVGEASNVIKLGATLAWESLGGVARRKFASSSVTETFFATLNQQETAGNNSNHLNNDARIHPSYLWKQIVWGGDRN